MIPMKAEQPVHICEKNLSLIDSSMNPPVYDRKNLKTGIVHMSLGAFHRSHQALYIHNLLQKQSGDWMICAIGLLSNDQKNIEAMQSQDNIYSVLERTSEKDELKIVGSIKETILASKDADAVMKRLTDPAVRIVSLTVTEKGYHYDEKGNLNFNSPSIQNDLNHPEAPETAIGLIVGSLARRRKAGIAPYTVMSCDNLPGNGHLTRKLVLQFAERIDITFKNWIEENVAFPNSMVDRITPVTTEEISKIVSEQFGLTDSWPVVCEDYLQWILEDSFCNGRPELQTVGVQLVKDVEPYEKMKVRLLNGSHSALAYMSYLLGYRRVDKAMADPDIRAFVRRYMDKDVTPTLPEVPGIDLTLYKDKLIDRFSNTAIADQVQRLAEDGSRKIPNAIIPCIMHQIKTGGTYKLATLALASWLSYLTGTDEDLKPIEIKDPLKDKLQGLLKLDSLDMKPILGIAEIFGNELANNADFINEINTARQSIHAKGMRQTLKDYLT